LTLIALILLLATQPPPKDILPRYAAAMAGMLQLKPGMSAAEVGSGAGLLTKLTKEQVGESGHVVVGPLESLEKESFDAVALLQIYSAAAKRSETLEAAKTALKPGGLLLIVDYPRSGSGTNVAGVDADDVIAAGKAAGFAYVDEIGVVPGHYSLRFRKQK
jgi:predicted methyltransferase